MMEVSRYLDLKERLLSLGYEEEIDWAETVGPPKDSLHFFCEYSWVVVNSGMKNQIAAKIWKRIVEALTEGQKVIAAFGHPGKAEAIQSAWDNREQLFKEFLRQPADNILNWLQSLPWIGPITKYHLAKNYGADVCKPDRHLVRISKKYGVSPEQLCGDLSRETGDRIGTVDLVIWRAANLGMI